MLRSRSLRFPCSLGIEVRPHRFRFLQPRLLMEGRLQLLLLTGIRLLMNPLQALHPFQHQCQLHRRQRLCPSYRLFEVVLLQALHQLPGYHPAQAHQFLARPLLLVLLGLQKFLLHLAHQAPDRQGPVQFQVQRALMSPTFPELLRLRYRLVVQVRHRKHCIWTLHRRM